MAGEPNVPGPFAIKDCALVALATGRRAQNLRELRDQVMEIHAGSLFHHFWGGLLLPRFEEPEYNNDFAAWARHCLHDNRLAERLAVIDPTDFPDLEALRRELLEVIEERLEESEHVPWTKGDQQFQFVRSQVVVFDTHKRAETPEALGEMIPHLPVGSIFYHFIDARRRPPVRVDDFRAWLSGCGDRYAPLVDGLSAVDPFFATLTQLRAQLAAVFQEHLPRSG